MSQSSDSASPNFDFVAIGQHIYRVQIGVMLLAIVAILSGGIDPNMRKLDSELGAALAVRTRDSEHIAAQLRNNLAGIAFSATEYTPQEVRGAIETMLMHQDELYKKQLRVRELRDTLEDRVKNASHAVNKNMDDYNGAVSAVRLAAIQLAQEVGDSVLVWRVANMAARLGYQVADTEIKATVSPVSEKAATELDRALKEHTAIALRVTAARSAEEGLRQIERPDLIAQASLYVGACSSLVDCSVKVKSARNRSIKLPLIDTTIESYRLQRTVATFLAAGFLYLSLRFLLITHMEFIGLEGALSYRSQVYLSLPPTRLARRMVRQSPSKSTPVPRLCFALDLGIYALAGLSLWALYVLGALHLNEWSLWLPLAVCAFLYTWASTCLSARLFDEERRVESLGTSIT